MKLVLCARASFHGCTGTLSLTSCCSIILKQELDVSVDFSRIGTVRHACVAFFVACDVEQWQLAGTEWVKVKLLAKLIKYARLEVAYMQRMPL
jgi:hypothetical protein